MQKLLTVVLLAAASLAVATSFAQQEGGAAVSGKQKKAPPKAKELNRSEIDSYLGKPDALFIDVRRPDEVSSIGGFPVYLSIQLADLPNHLAEIPKDRTIITVSNHANRARAAADLLDSKGFKVAGGAGVQDYEAEGGKALHVPVPPPAAGKK